MTEKPARKRRWSRCEDAAHRDRIPSVLDVISVNSWVILPFLFGLLGLMVCLAKYTITGYEYSDSQTFGGYVGIFSVMFAGGTLLIIRRVRTIQHLFRHGLKCSGSVVRISHDGKWAIGPFQGETSVMRRCVYEYKIDGKTYRSRSRFEGRVLHQPISPGDIVTVMVDPHRPAVSVLMALYEA